MPTLQELIDQQAALDRQIEALRRESRTKAIAEVKAILATHELTMADISAASAAPRRGPKTGGTPVAAKYRHPESGATWTGRGLKPRWLAAELAAGKKLEDFTV